MRTSAPDVKCENRDKNGIDGKAKGNIQKKEKEQSTQPLTDTAAAAVVNGDVNGNVIELDAKTLARDCLKELGREMGVSS